jgi:hypothetical protein
MGNDDPRLLRPRLHGVSAEEQGGARCDLIIPTTSEFESRRLTGAVFVWYIVMMARAHKITLGEMRSSVVRRLLIYCSDVKCSNWIRLGADACAPWPDDMRLSDLEKQFACKACAPRAPTSGQILIGISPSIAVDWSVAMNQPSKMLMNINWRAGYGD